MKCNDFDRRKARHHMNLDNASCRVDRITSAQHNLDRALHDLGMLSTVTDARREYLRETKSDCCMMRLNTRYVSDVTVGYCMKRAATKNRLCPYVLPSRHRTKSENSEAVGESAEYQNQEYPGSLLEPSTSGCLPAPSPPAKRCQSLENLNLSETSASSETSQEMDCVSTQIQKLQVDE